MTALCPRGNLNTQRNQGFTCAEDDPYKDKAASRSTGLQVYKPRRKAKQILPLQPSENQSASTSILDSDPSLWTVRKVNFCCLSHQSVVCCYGSLANKYMMYSLCSDLKFVACFIEYFLNIKQRMKLKAILLFKRQ